jgi:hypothetical protein
LETKYFLKNAPHYYYIASGDVFGFGFDSDYYENVYYYSFKVKIKCTLQESNINEFKI